MDDLPELCELGMPDYRYGWHDRAWWGHRNMHVPFPAPENDNGDVDVDEDEFAKYPWDEPLPPAQIAKRNRPIAAFRNRTERN